MFQEAAKLETLSRKEFVAFLEGIGKTTVDGRPAEASRTAFVTAFIRAFHSANENPKVFDDWMAARLLTTEEYSFPPSPPLPRKPPKSSLKSRPNKPRILWANSLDAPLPSQ